MGGRLGGIRVATVNCLCEETAAMVRSPARTHPVGAVRWWWQIGQGQGALVTRKRGGSNSTAMTVTGRQVVSTVTVPSGSERGSISSSPGCSQFPSTYWLIGINSGKGCSGPKLILA